MMNEATEKTGYSDKRQHSLKLTPRSRHAVMAMIELAQHTAEHSKGNPVPLSIIAQAGKISLSYLEQLFAGLRRHGLVISARGPGGGYTLARDPSAIIISDIFIAAEDSVPGKRMLAREENDNYGNAATQTLWSHIGRVLYDDLSQLTLAEVLEKKI